MPSFSLRRFVLAVILTILPIGMTAQKTYKLKKWHVPAAHYSGITPMGDGRYAVVSDEESQAGFYVWRVEIDTLKGRVRNVSDEGFRGVAFDIDRDAEGVAFCPPLQTVFVSGEADQRILEHRIDGTLTGRELAVPTDYGKSRIQANRGFEALGYDSLRASFWTSPESPLQGESGLRVPLLRFGTDLRLQQTVDYELDAPQARNHGRDHYHGVVAITPMADGTLLILEREARIARRYSGSRCWCRLYQFDPSTGTKRLRSQWCTRLTPTNSRFSNYEGMCLGPKLADGRQTVLLVADSQGGYGRALWHLRDKLRLLILEPEEQE